MKLINLTIATICCILFLSIQPRTASASENFNIDSTCCDTAKIYSDQDSSSTDSCFGNVYFFISPDSNCIIKNVVSNKFDSLIWIDSISTFYGKYSIVKGSSELVYGYFLDNNGDTICTKSIELKCRSCCDSSLVYHIPDSTNIDSCIGYVFFKFDTLCEIASFRSSLLNDSLMVWDTLALAYKVPYYLQEDSLEVFGYFIDEFGDTICIKSTMIYCDKNGNCCDVITFQDFPNNSFPNEPCCGTFTVNTANCAEYFTFYDNSPGGPETLTQLGPNTFEYCITYGNSFEVLFSFYNSLGELICHKTFSKYCFEGFLKKFDSKKVKDESIIIYPNPVENELKIRYGKNTIKQNSQINIYSISGNLVKSIIVSTNESQNELILNIDDLSQGMYLIEIYKTDSVFRSKINVVK